MAFMKMDAMNMTFPSESFDVVLEKGTLDALYTGSADFASKASREGRATEAFPQVLPCICLLETARSIV